MERPTEILETAAHRVTLFIRFFIERDRIGNHGKECSRLSNGRQKFFGYHGFELEGCKGSSIFVGRERRFRIDMRHSSRLRNPMHVELVAGIYPDNAVL